ncbi:MAG TPA: hypothetical protein VFG47_13775 [Geminicoccaceae bacterium]|nr:hypothetical protein [Geminicoccaceae bacterium]
MDEAVIRREILILGAEDPGGLWEIAGRINALSPKETDAGRLDVARAVLSSLLEKDLVSLVWSDGDFEPIRSIGRDEAVALVQDDRWWHPPGQGETRWVTFATTERGLAALRRDGAA